MNANESQIVEDFSRWFAPNPFKHGILTNFKDGKKKAVTNEGEPVTPTLLKAHLLGTGRHIGYLPGTDTGTRVGVIDLDGKEFGEGLDNAKEAVIKAALGAGLHPYAEKSLSGCGWHLWLWSSTDLPYTVMTGGLKQLTRQAGLPKATETYPMGANATSRWIFTPYYGALTKPDGLGRTYLLDADGKGIRLRDLDDQLKAGEAAAFRALYEVGAQGSHQTAPKKRGTTSTVQKSTEGTLEQLCRIARQRPPEKRHDTLMAFLNLAHRERAVVQMADSLKGQDVFALWCSDASRTLEEWASEIDRIVAEILANPDEARPLRGIPYLVEQGFEVGDMRVGENEKAESDKRSSVSARVLDLVLAEGTEAWHDEHGTAYLSVKSGEQLEHYRLNSRGTRDYITGVVFEAENRPLSAQALNEVINVLESLGRRKGPQHPTGVRVKAWQDHLYLDLGREDWAMVEVGPGGWKLISAAACPVRFTRSNQMLPLPIPVHGGRLDTISDLLNTDDSGCLLAIAFLLAALAGRGPYPHLALKGEQGVGKSTAATTLQRLIDPGVATRRRAPRKEQDLYIAARNAHLLNFDNLSHISGDLSDSLCVLSTGGSFATRTLHTNDEETVLQAMRPAILNGITDLITRADLAERTVLVELKRINPEQRKTEQELEARFTQLHPSLLGALLTALATALRNLPTTHIERPPRLADFAKLIVAAEPSLPCAPGEFMKVYAAMQTESAGSVLDGDELAGALRTFMDERSTNGWRGPVNSLLVLLNEQEGFMTGARRMPTEWPKNPRALGERLRRFAPAFQKIGYTVESLGRKNDGSHYALQITPSTITTYTRRE